MPGGIRVFIENSGVRAAGDRGGSLAKVQEALRGLDCSIRGAAREA